MSLHFQHTTIAFISLCPVALLRGGPHPGAPSYRGDTIQFFTSAGNPPQAQWPCLAMCSRSEHPCNLFPVWTKKRVLHYFDTKAMQFHPYILYCWICIAQILHVMQCSVNHMHECEPSHSVLFGAGIHIWHYIAASVAFNRCQYGDRGTK